MPGDAGEQVDPYQHGGRVRTSSGQRNRIALVTGPDQWCKRPMVFGVRCHGDLDQALIAESLQWLARRHTALRMYFPDLSDPDWAYIAPHDEADWPLAVTDLSGLPIEAVPAAEHQALAHLSMPMDLASRPLLRAALLSAGKDHLLALAVDHAIFDGESISVLFRDLSHIYNHLTNDRDRVLIDTLVSDYAAFAATECDSVVTQRGLTELAYWAPTWRQLGPYPPLHLPSQVRHMLSGHGRYLERRLTSAETKKIATNARKMRLTPYMLTAASIIHLLGQVTGEENIGIISPYARRLAHHEAHIVGYVNSRMLLRVHVPTPMEFKTTAQATKEATLQGLRHGMVGFDALLRHFHPELYDHRPLTPYLFLNVLNTPIPPTLTGVSTTFDWLEQPGFYEQFPGITVSLDHQREGAELGCGYSVNRYDDALIEHFMNNAAQLMLDPPD